MAPKQGSGSKEFCKKFLCSASVTACALMLLRTFRMSNPFDGVEFIQTSRSLLQDLQAKGGDGQEEFHPVKFITSPPAAPPAPPAPAAKTVAVEVMASETPGESYNGHFLHRLSAKKPGCKGCCNLGEKVVDCLDVEKCAEKGPENGKYALVLSHWGIPSEGMLQSITSMKAAAMATNADILVMMLQRDASRIPGKVDSMLKKWGVKVHVVPWDVPPGSMYNPRHDWCGHQDLIRLHTVGLEGYDAVAYYDADCEFQGDILPVLKCAARGYFLSTNGGVGEALNIGFIAVRPSPQLLEAALIFARSNNFTIRDGWGNTGWKPCGGYYVGGECGQGFFYSLYYSKSKAARKALEEAGIWDNGAFEPAQIDRCLWNYQTSYQCRPEFDCERVRVHHKPTKERGTDRNECEKLKYRERRKEAARKKKLARAPPTAEELAAATQGVLLRHSGGLCVQSNDADGMLLLSDCDGDPTKNIRLVNSEDDDAESLGEVYLKMGKKCSHPQGDEDEDTAPAEPRLIFDDCSSRDHHFVFKRLKAEDGSSFLLEHKGSRRCVHPFEGQDRPHEGTELLLHSDCSTARKALTFQTKAMAGSKAAATPEPKMPLTVAAQEPCQYMKGSPQSSRPGKPCLPPAKFWPYKAKTQWRIDLGERILAAVTPKISEKVCDGFYLYGDVTWCNRAFSAGPAALIALSYGIEERDIWSELMSQKGLRTKLYDCFIPPDRSTPISGKAPNGTKRCKGVEKKPCYTTTYESYRICLGAEPKVEEGRRFETLLPHLAEYPPLSVHLKIDTEGSEWSVLEQLMDSPDKGKIRTLDMEVHFGWDNQGNFAHTRKMSKKELLQSHVAIMESLLEEFECTGSTLEVYREGWNPQDCPKSKCNEPPVYLPGGFSVEMFAVSFVNKAMLKPHGASAL
ncbi:unnamed protein product [Cladocopium goreaui]|uniref:Nucleotide-diphospho-sugar transferase domain-containing protein n=1 Tax=Cladocopium goreaui TaxID=2562237 RepID=A0A9P1CCI2_9DINO|nr:unnamed protein product [Cladocopium goreaui]